MSTLEEKLHLREIRRDTSQTMGFGLPPEKKQIPPLSFSYFLWVQVDNEKGSVSVQCSESPRDGPCEMIQTIVESLMHRDDTRGFVSKFEELVFDKERLVRDKNQLVDDKNALSKEIHDLRAIQKQQ